MVRKHNPQAEASRQEAIRRQFADATREIEARRIKASLLSAANLARQSRDTRSQFNALFVAA